MARCKAAAHAGVWTESGKHQRLGSNSAPSAVRVQSFSQEQPSQEQLDVLAELLSLHAREGHVSYAGYCRVQSTPCYTRQQSKASPCPAAGR